MAVSQRTAFKEALTFDDVLLLPGHSEILPSGVDLRTRLTPEITLNLNPNSNEEIILNLFNSAAQASTPASTQGNAVNTAA